MKFYLYLLTLPLLTGCVTSPPTVTYSSDSFVTVRQVNLGFAPLLTPQVRDLANRKCKEIGKRAVHVKTRDSGVGPESFDFRCVSDSPRPTPPVTVRVSPSPHPEDPPPKKVSSSTGSGFFVSKLGHIITNQHVIDECDNVTVGDKSETQVPATLVEADSRNDLALLRISSDVLASNDTRSLISKLETNFIPFATQGLLRLNEVELGEDMLVAGYPFGDIFNNSIKVTKGIVSSNRGIGDDTGQFQIDAAVQPGNSGGPIYDENGNIVGVVVAQLNKLKVAKAIGSLPENVNFGIKASIVRQFLTSSGLPTKWSNRSRKMSTKDIAKIAKNQTVMVVCHR